MTFVSGDLLAMNMRDNREQLSALAAEPDPAEAAKLQQQQQQQQTQNKLNRKQRRKLQQQQQAEEQTPAVSVPDIKQSPSELSVSQGVTQSSETLANQQQNKTIDTISTSTYKAEDSQEDANSKHTATPTTKNDKPEQSVAGATKPANGQQTQSLTSNKRAGPPLIPPSPGPGVQGPLRASLTHPFLHPQLVQQLHLQQLRMAQGGLLQPPFTAQQFAMLQQIAQLQLVQQRLAAQSVAQQHLGQKQVIPQPQLYQQQQQVALMIAQMQQQVLQQQPGLAGRHPALQFTGVQQPVTQQPQQQPSPTSQPKVSEPLNNSDKLAGEPPQTKADTVKTQVSETVIPPPATVEEQGKQHSPVPQSRLTQWKQPLLQDPNTTVVQPPVSSTPTLSDSKPPTASLSSSSQSAPTMLPNLVSTPSVSTSDGSDLQVSNSNTVSPRPRIPDPVSSRWGVDAGPKLSADPTEFKPGVPWRPAPKNEKKEEVRDANLSSSIEISSRSSSSSSEPQPEKWSAAANPSANAANNLPPSVAGKTSEETLSTVPSNGSGRSINSNSTFDSSKNDFVSKSASWQANDNKTPPPPFQEGDKQASSVLSPLRPPPGLGTESTLPESPLFGDDPPAWLKSLIDTGFSGDKTQPEFQFSRFGFANHSAPWSPRDTGTQPFSPSSPDPQPWAAVGGPTPISSTSSPTVLLANNASTVACIESSSNLQNSGIIWSTNQPIPSAEEKLTGVHPGVASTPPVSMPSSLAVSRSTPNSMSTWLVLRNLSPRVSKEAGNLSALFSCACSSLSR